MSWGSGPHWGVAAQRRFYCNCVMRLRTSLRCSCSKEVLLYLCHEAQDLIEMWLLKGGSTVPVLWGSGPHWDVAAQRRFYCTCVMRFRTSLRCGHSKEVLLYLCHEVQDLIEVWLLKGGSTLPVSWGWGLIKMWPLKGGCTVPVSWGSGPHWCVAAQRRFYCTCVIRLRTSLRCDHSKEVLL